MKDSVHVVTTWVGQLAYLVCPVTQMNHSPISDVMSDLDPCVHLILFQQRICTISEKWYREK